MLVAIELCLLVAGTAVIVIIADVVGKRIN